MWTRTLTLIALLCAPLLTHAEARVLLPNDNTRTVVFPLATVVSCVIYDEAAAGNLASVTVSTCLPYAIHTVRVNGVLYLLNRPEARILESCADVGCFIINTEVQ